MSLTTPSYAWQRAKFKFHQQIFKHYGGPRVNLPSEN